MIRVESGFEEKGTSLNEDSSEANIIDDNEIELCEETITEHGRKYGGHTYFIGFRKYKNIWIPMCDSISYMKYVKFLFIFSQLVVNI